MIKIEPDIIINCSKPCNNKTNCTKTIVAILSVILAFAIGIVIQSVVDVASILSLVYFIAIITILIIDIIAILVYEKCTCRK